MRVSFLLVLLAAVIAWASAAPVSDSEATYRILNKYLQRFGSDDLQDLYYGSEHGSAKRGLGPRPLRFG